MVPIRGSGADVMSVSQPLAASVVIPVRNRPEDLRRCLRMIGNQTFPLDRFEVLVCDDGSEDEVQPVAGEAASAGLAVRYVCQQARGPAAARNLGIRHAVAPIVAMTDSDTQPDRAWLEELVKALEINPEAVGVEGKVCADNDDEFGPLGEGPTNLEGGVFLTCNCAYRRDALLQVGGFDESFPYPAYEDVDLAARIQTLGPIVWQPDAVVMHSQRPLTLRTVWKKLHHWPYILQTGLRYGYLGWKRYPVRHPRLRVLLLSVVALPLSKLRTASQWLLRRPGGAARLAFLGLAEALGAVVVVAPGLAGSRVYKPLSTLASSNEG